MSNLCTLCTREAFEVTGNCPTTCLRALQSCTNKIHLVRLDAGNVDPVWVGYLCLGSSLRRDWSIRDAAGVLAAACEVDVTLGLWTKCGSGWIPENETTSIIHGPYWSWLLPVRVKGFDHTQRKRFFDVDAHILIVCPYDVDPNDIRI